ncbi:MAG TPA: hypothetical protein PKD12_16665 [Nitrospira sp.]|nr:hypothetical protein [Nitrospira sp.]
MPKAYLVDMDGVLVKGRESIPGAGQFVTRLKVAGVPFLMFTNNSRFTPADHRACLSVAGLDIPAEAIFTSAIATSHFLHQQHPRRTAYVIGESGLATALDRVG